MLVEYNKHIYCYLAYIMIISLLYTVSTQWLYNQLSLYTFSLVSYIAIQLHVLDSLTFTKSSDTQNKKTPRVQKGKANQKQQLSDYNLAT